MSTLKTYQAVVEASATEEFGNVVVGAGLGGRRRKTVSGTVPRTRRLPGPIPAGHFGQTPRTS
jgi:hypothetical protein